jgi:elongation factor P--(R)-beta-lysine ligase
MMHPKPDDGISSLSASLAMLAKRSQLLRKLRKFFYDRNFIEVETPLLAREVIPELHIEPFHVEGGGLLQASPELHMKQLLVGGAKAIFQVTRSFRQGERGQLHNPEFTMVEWYRVGDDMAAGIALLDELTRSLLTTPPAKRTRYAAAFQEHLGVNPHTASLVELATAAEVAGIAVPDDFDRRNRDQWLNLLLALRVEPQLGRDLPEILYHYPASQSALAKTAIDSAGHQVAERFELYYRGIELANGYHELADASELRRRFDAVNAARATEGRQQLPIPDKWLAAMQIGMPVCTGVALGFDRLMMLAVEARTIDDVMAIVSGPRPGE